jgi:hypothetical protein
MPRSLLGYFTQRGRAQSAKAFTSITGIAILLVAATSAWAAEIPVTSVAGFPNGRTLNDLPPNAIDGDTTTFTWTTNPNNTASPSHLAIGFASTPVHRIRLWKDKDGGGGQTSRTSRSSTPPMTAASRSALAPGSR